MTPTARAINLMEFNPSLPYLKKIALDALNYFGSVKVFLKFSRPFWSEPNKLKVINYDSKTQPNGGTGISDDLLRIVSTGCPAKLFTLGYLFFCRLLLMQIAKSGTFLKNSGNLLHDRHKNFENRFRNS